MKYARIADDFVIEVFVEPEGFTIDQCFHPDIAAQFVVVADNIEAGWIKQSDGSFVAPPPPPPPLTPEQIAALENT